MVALDIEFMFHCYSVFITKTFFSELNWLIIEITWLYNVTRVILQLVQVTKSIFYISITLGIESVLHRFLSIYSYSYRFLKNINNIK